MTFQDEDIYLFPLGFLRLAMRLAYLKFTDVTYMLRLSRSEHF